MEYLTQSALNTHVNILLEKHRRNPAQVNKHWTIKYNTQDRTYEVQIDNISALYIIDYMRRARLDTFLRFRLQTTDDQSDVNMFYTLYLD